MTEISKEQTLFLKKKKHHHQMVHFTRIAILVFFLLIWELSANTGFIDSFIFSSPSRILNCFWEMFIDKSIFLHIGITLYETFVSFVIVTILSILFATLLWLCPTFSEVTDPYLVILNSLPKSALAPLLIVWLGANQTTIITAGMSVAFFGSILSLHSSFQETEIEKLTLIYTLGGNKLHALAKVVIPGNIPAIISTMKVNIGLCLVGVVIGEFIGGRSGLGYMIIYASQVFQLDRLILAICILCIIAMGLYALIGTFEKWYSKRT